MPFPIGENDQTQENINTKMQRTFALRRHDVLRCAPMISDVLTRWPALFDVTEVCDRCLLLGEYVL